MNVSKDYSNTFRPFNLVIEVTSKEEEDALKNLFVLDHTIPDTVRWNSDIGSAGEDILHNLFDRTYKTLQA